MSDCVTIVIDRELLEDYSNLYKKRHPKSTKMWFTNQWKKRKPNGKEKYLYGVLTLNDLLPISSMAYSTLKKTWGDLGLFIANECNIANKKITNAVVEYRVFSETKAKKDIDNLVGASKILNDCLFVKSGAFEDDNYNLINPFIGSAEVDREYPRTEIRISIIDDKIKDIYEKMKIHVNNFEGEK